MEHPPSRSPTKRLSVVDARDYRVRMDSASIDFTHSASILEAFPQLAVAAIRVEGVTTASDVAGNIAPFHARATARLEAGTESEFPEIAAWRRAFSQMGLKPTQYRCASEALLRRFRKEGSLPAIHPLIDLCNAASVAFAIPIAVFDIDRIEGALEVRRAESDEVYVTFGGETEHPEPGEIIYADAAGNAHARRWTNRQSARSAIRPATSRALIVAEALHDSAGADVERLRVELSSALSERGWLPQH